MGQGLVKKRPESFPIAWLLENLVAIKLDCYRSMTVFQSFDEVDSDSFCLFFVASVGGGLSLELPTLPFSDVT